VKEGERAIWLENLFKAKAFSINFPAAVFGASRQHRKTAAKNFIYLY